MVKNFPGNSEQQALININKNITGVNKKSMEKHFKVHIRYLARNLMSEVSFRPRVISRSHYRRACKYAD